MIVACRFAPCYKGGTLELKLETYKMPNILNTYMSYVKSFALDILGLPIPEKPTRLSTPRKKWASLALLEELVEFQDAETLADEVDALVDLIYFATGRLVEMGVPPLPVFEEVHSANMKKERGTLSKRPDSLGYDAIKPEGWTAPDLSRYLEVTKQDIDFLSTPITVQDVEAEVDTFMQVFFPQSPAFFHLPPEIEMAAEPEMELTPFLNGDRPRILLMGYARHGKDTVAEIMRDKYGLSFQSSSMFCAEHVVMPAMAQEYGIRYDTAEDCFNDRAHWRSAWYNIIKNYNSPDATRLGRAIFSEFDIYAGVRSSTEFNAMRNATDVFDLALWVDRSMHLPPEPKNSCTVEPWMAHYTIDNNGTLEDLERNIDQLFDNIIFLSKNQ